MSSVMTDEVRAIIARLDNGAEEVSFDKRKIGNAGVKALAGKLERNKTLKRLTLDNNMIGATGALALARVLEANDTLQSLSLNHNTIGDAGVEALMQALKTNKSLKSLSIQYNNNVGGRGAEAIAQALEGKTALRYIGLPYIVDKSVLGRIKCQLSAMKTRAADAMKTRAADASAKETPLEVKEMSLEELIRKAEIADQVSANANLKVHAARIKITVVGGEGAGKTCTVRTLLGQPASSPDEPTCGMELTFARTSDWRPQKHADAIACDVPELVRTNQGRWSALSGRTEYDSSLAIWDCSGQDVFRGLHTLFFTRSGVYLVVFDMEEVIDERPARRARALAQVRFWVDQVRDRASQASLVLVGTHADKVSSLEQHRKVHTAIMRDLDLRNTQLLRDQHHLAFFPVDNITRETSDTLASRLRECVARAAAQEARTDGGVPLPWLYCLDKMLASQNPVVMSQSNVEALAHKSCVRRKTELSAMLTHMCKSGILASLDSVPGVDDAVVLRPHILFERLSRVLLRSSPAEARGTQVLKPAGDSQAQITAALHALTTRGVVSPALLRHLWHGEDNGEPVDLFRKILCGTLLAMPSPWVGTKDERGSLLVPCLQDAASDTERETMRAALPDATKAYLELAASFMSPELVLQRLVACLARDGAREGLHAQADAYKVLHIFSDAACLESRIGKLFLETTPTSVVLRFDGEDHAQQMRLLKVKVREINRGLPMPGLQLRPQNEALQSYLSFVCFARAVSQPVPPLSMSFDGRHQARSPLMWASGCGSASFAAWLLERGADVNLCDASGANALLLACQEGHVDTASLLVAHGASFDPQSEAFLAVMTRSYTSCRYQEARLLMDRAWDAHQEQQSAIEAAMTQIFDATATAIKSLKSLSSLDNTVAAAETAFKDFAKLQEAVTTDASRAPERNKMRADLIQHTTQKLADPDFKAKIAGLDGVCVFEDTWSHAWGLVSEDPLNLPPQNLCPKLAEAEKAQASAQAALAAWTGRHDIYLSRTQTVAAMDLYEAQREASAAASVGFGSSEDRSGQQTVFRRFGNLFPHQVKRAVFHAQEQETGLTSMKETVQLAFEEELYTLQSDDPMGDAPRETLQSAIKTIAAFLAVSVPAKVAKLRDRLAGVTKQLKHVAKGMRAPQMTSVRSLLRELPQIRRTELTLRADLECAQDEARVGVASAAARVAKLEAKLEAFEGVSAQEHKIRIARERVLRFAECHYPELLCDENWRASLGMSNEPRTASSGCVPWLELAKKRDFKVVKKLASKLGKETFRVRDKDGRDRVLKTFYMKHRAAKTGFDHEIEAGAQVRSAFVVRNEGVFMDNPHMGCILRPFYAEGSLAKWMGANQHAGIDYRKRIAVGILTGAHDLHERGLVHGDITPANVFLARGLSPVLGEWEGTFRSDSGTAPSSRSYTAPEARSRPSAALQPAVDLFSIGSVLDELFPDPLQPMRALITALRSTDPSQRPSALDALHHEAFASDPVETQSCGVCYDDFVEGDGASCDDGHFTCSSCLGRAVCAAAEPDAHIHVLRDGSMKCFSPGCEHMVSGKTLAAALPGEDFAALLKIFQQKFERDAALEQEDEVRRRVESALRDHKLNILDQESSKHLRAIQDQILSLACPRCKTAFYDFSGCCALKCSNKDCGCHFCAWCLQDTGSTSEDCHTHVRGCNAKPAGEDPYFCRDPAALEQAWASIRARRLREYLARVITDELRVKVYEKLRPHLTPDLVGRDFRLDLA